MMSCRVGTFISRVASLALLTVAFPGSAERARAVSVWGGRGDLAPAAGPVLGGLMIDRSGWAADSL